MKNNSRKNTSQQSSTIPLVELYLDSGKIFIKSDEALKNKAGINSMALAFQLEWIAPYVKDIFEGVLPKTITPLWLASIHAAPSMHAKENLALYGVANGDLFTKIEETDITTRLVDDLIVCMKEH